MTAITLTEADRIDHNSKESLSGYWIVGFVGPDGMIRREYKLDGDRIKIAEPEKPPGMVLMKNADYQSWCFSIDHNLAFFYDKMSAYPLKNCTIIDNPHNDPTLAAAIRAAQEVE